MERILTGLTAGWLVAAALAGAPPATAATLVVDDDRADCPAAAHTSIQGAVDAAADGAAIRVCAGRYREQVVVPPGKDGIQLVAHGGRPVVDAGGLASAGQVRAAVVLHGIGVALRGFEVTGALPSPGAGFTCEDHGHPSGIAVPEGSVLVDRALVHELSDPACEDFVSGIRTGDAEGDLGTEGPVAVATVDRTAVERVPGHAVHAESGEIRVDRSRLLDSGAGLTTGAVARVRARANLVAGNAGEGIATGEEAERVVLRGNRVLGNGSGIAVGGASGAVERNVAGDNAAYGIAALLTGALIRRNVALGNGELDCYDPYESGRWQDNVGRTVSLAGICLPPRD